MGNFSRDTFHPEKNYVGVRLQQGVPLVDADWNEQNDVIRQDLYNGLAAICPDGVARISPADRVQLLATAPKIDAAYAFQISAHGWLNDFRFMGGTAIVGGRPAQLPVQWFQYSTQEWTNATKAARAGVAVIPPLTTSVAAQSDLVYLDVWEREVGLAEDFDIINPVIGVETAVRLKREVAVRVVEGSTSLPPAAVGHRLMPVAVLNRAAGQGYFQFKVEDRRSFIDSSPAIRYMSLKPAFQPIQGFDPWLNWIELATLKTWANKAQGQNAGGQLPLILPHGSRLNALEYRVNTGGYNGWFKLHLIRSPTNLAFNPIHIASDTILVPGNFNRSVAIEPADIVDNAGYVYSLFALGQGITFLVQVHSLTIIYEY